MRSLTSWSARTLTSESVPRSEWRSIERVTDSSPGRSRGNIRTSGRSDTGAYRSAHPGASAGDLLPAIQTDSWERIPAIRLGDAHARSASATYMYEFAWRSPEVLTDSLVLAMGSRLPSSSTLSIRSSSRCWVRFWEATLLNSSPIQCMRRWVAFATNGDSGWPAYDLSRRATIRFDTTSQVVFDPRSAERTMWEGMR